MMYKRTIELLSYLKYRVLQILILEILILFTIKKNFNMVKLKTSTAYINGTNLYCGTFTANRKKRMRLPSMNHNR